MPNKSVFFRLWDVIEFESPIAIERLPNNLEGKGVLVFNSWKEYTDWLGEAPYFIGYVQVNVEDTQGYPYPMFYPQSGKIEILAKVDGDHPMLITIDTEKQSATFEGYD